MGRVCAPPLVVQVACGAELVRHHPGVGGAEGRLTASVPGWWPVMDLHPGTSP